MNQRKKTYQFIEKNFDDASYLSLHQIMSQLEDNCLVSATSYHLALITEVTEHSLHANVSKKEIIKAYRSLALVYHPDRGSAKNTAKFQEIAEAYEHLSNETNRKIYDAGLEKINQETSKKTLEDLFKPSDLLYKKYYPMMYERYTDPESDFSQEDNHSMAYKLRERLYAPDGYNIRSLNNLKNKQFESNSITSQRTLKSYEKHFKQRFYDVTNSFYLDTKENRLDLPQSASFYSRAINGNYSVSEYAYLSKEKIKKYISSTFLPYQTIDQIYNAWFQPFIGLKYLFSSLYLIILTILTFPIVVYFALSKKSLEELNHPLFIPGLILLIVGLSLLLTTPLTWLVQMPIRATFNLLRQGWGRIEDGFHIQRIITEAEKAIEFNNKPDCITTIALLHKKFKLNLICKDRVTDIDSNDEEARYELLDKDFVLGTLNVHSETPITPTQQTHLLSYLSLFKTAKCYKHDIMKADCQQKNHNSIN